MAYADLQASQHILNSDGEVSWPDASISERRQVTYGLLTEHLDCPLHADLLGVHQVACQQANAPGLELRLRGDLHQCRHLGPFQQGRCQQNNIIQGEWPKIRIVGLVAELVK